MNVDNILASTTYYVIVFLLEAKMDYQDTKSHWDNVYSTKKSTEVSWYESNPEISLKLISDLNYGKHASVIDVGGGLSLLVDRLLDQGFLRITVLDISAEAISIAKMRLGVRANSVQWVVSNICDWRPKPDSVDVWHDRATFHFISYPKDRDAYVACMKQAIRKGGHAIIATFAEDGPTKCSGLPVVRYNSTRLKSVLGSEFSWVRHLNHTHITPSGVKQSFQFSVFKRI